MSIVSYFGRLTVAGTQTLYLLFCSIQSLNQPNWDDLLKTCYFWLTEAVVLVFSTPCINVFIYLLYLLFTNLAPVLKLTKCGLLSISVAPIYYTAVRWQCRLTSYIILLLRLAYICSSCNSTLINLPSVFSCFLTMCENGTIYTANEQTMCTRVCMFMFSVSTRARNRSFIPRNNKRQCRWNISTGLHCRYICQHWNTSNSH